MQQPDTPIDRVPQDEPARTDVPGPVELDSSFFALVAGGSPRGTWLGSESAIQSPRGTW